MLLTEHIENYPGFPDGITGQALISEFMRQAQKWGCLVRTHAGTATMGLGSDGFSINTREGEFECSSAIVATGCQPCRLNVPGESKFLGAGISYCAVCDGSFFEDFDVVVVGGGDAALEEALYLAKICRKVHIVHRRDRFRGTECLQNLVFNNPRISTIMCSVLDSFEGTDILESVRLRCVTTNECTDLPVSGAFIYVGQTPRSAVLPPEVARDEAGYIITDEHMQTSVPGIFAAGDVRKKLIRQISTAVGDGTVAALAAEKFLMLKQCLPR